MKGLIFTEFIEMVENQMGFEMANSIIEDAQLKSQGIYTSVGTYHEEEMISLLIQLSKRSGLSIPELLESYGQYLFGRFAILYTHFFTNKNSSFEFLEKIEDYIHVEVLKLYPDALLPVIEIRDQTNDCMTMIYKSPRRLVHLAIGLIKGCSDHFKENLEISIKKELNEGTEVWIEIKKI